MRVAVRVSPHTLLLTVLTTAMVTFVPSAMSLAVGKSKFHAVPEFTVLFVTQVITGAVVSTTFTVWLHAFVLPQASVAFQVRVALKVLPHAALVAVPTIVMG